MVNRFAEFSNKYLTSYNPTPEEIGVADAIIANFEGNPDPLPLFCGHIDNLIGSYDSNYYRGDSGIRAKVVEALVISKIKGVRALFVFKSKKDKSLRWLVTKGPDEMRRTIISNLILYGKSTTKAEEEGNRAIDVIINSDDTLMTILCVNEEGMP